MAATQNDFLKAPRLQLICQPSQTLQQAINAWNRVVRFKPWRVYARMFAYLSSVRGQAAEGDLEFWFPNPGTARWIWRLKIAHTSFQVAASSRRVDFSSRKGRVVVHEILEVERGFRRYGIARRYLKNCVGLYHRWGVTKIIMRAGDTHGGYVWALAGFLPTAQQWPNLQAEIASRAAGLPLSIAEQVVVAAVINHSEPRMLQALLALQRPIGGNTVAGSILLGTTWDAELDFRRGSDGRRRYEVFLR